MKIPRLASDIIGRKIRSREGENIAAIQNLVLYPESNTIIYIVLCYANFIGRINRYYAIPNKILKFDSDVSGSFILEKNSEVLLSAPPLAQDKWPIPIWPPNDNHVYELLKY